MLGAVHQICHSIQYASKVTVSSHVYGRLLFEGMCDCGGKAALLQKKYQTTVCFYQ